MKCPKCGYSPILGRPKKISDQRVAELIGKGLSFTSIAKRLGVTEGAIRASVKREIKRLKI